MSKKSIERRERINKLLEAQYLSGLEEQQTLFDILLYWKSAWKAECDTEQNIQNRMMTEDKEIPPHLKFLLNKLIGLQLGLNGLEECVVIKTGYEYDAPDYECLAGHEGTFINMRDWTKAPIKPPFDNTFLDCGYVVIGDSGGGSDFRLCCNIVKLATDADEKLSDYEFNIINVNTNDINDIDPVHSIEVSSLLVRLDAFGFSNDSFSDYAWLRNSNKGDRAVNALFKVLEILQLLNCNNVEIVDNQPNVEASIHHKQRTGIPLTFYKTLRIRSIGKRSQTEEVKDYQGLMPLHLRRGHFATYTDDNPLFGKYTGVFWRPATTVGEEKNGVVIKDYEVQP